MVGATMLEEGPWSLDRPVIVEMDAFPGPPVPRTTAGCFFSCFASTAGLKGSLGSETDVSNSNSGIIRGGDEGDDGIRMSRMGCNEVRGAGMPFSRLLFNMYCIKSPFLVVPQCFDMSVMHRCGGVDIHAEGGGIDPFGPLLTLLYCGTRTTSTA